MDSQISGYVWTGPQRLCVIVFLKSLLIFNIFSEETSQTIDTVFHDLGKYQEIICLLNGGEIKLR